MVSPGTNGVMATVLANGSLSSKTSGEGDLRERLVERLSRMYCSASKTTIL